MNNDKMICKEFEDNVLSYIEEQLDKERHVKYSEHLRSCEDCSRVLSESIKIMELSKESDYDMLDQKFDEMITRATKRRAISIKEIFSFSDEKRMFYWKVVFASTLIIVSISVSLFSSRSNPVKVVSKEILDWEGTKIENDIADIKKSINTINTENWNAKVNLINNSIDELEKQSNKYSFN